MDYSISFQIPADIFDELKQPTAIYEELKLFFKKHVDFKRLYINYPKGYGTVYFYNQLDQDTLELVLKVSNPYNLMMLRPRDFNGDINAEVGISCVNTNGQSIALLEDPETSTRYVSIHDLERSGFKLYESVNEARSNVLHKLEAFLIAQAEIYLKLHHLKYMIPNDITLNVCFANETNAVQSGRDHSNNKFHATKLVNGKHTNSRSKKLAEAANYEKNYNKSSSNNQDNILGRKQGGQVKDIRQENVPIEHQNGRKQLPQDGQTWLKVSKKVEQGERKMVPKESTANKTIIMQEHIIHDPNMIKFIPKEHLGIKTFEKQEQSSLKTLMKENIDTVNLPRGASSETQSLHADEHCGSSVKSSSSSRLTTRELIKKIRDTKTSKIQQYPVASTFISKMAGMQDAHLQILKVVSESSFIAFVVCEAAIDFEEMLNKIPWETSSASRVGDLVLVKPDDKRSRAYILELKGNKYVVALVDYGEVIEVETVFKVPNEMKCFDEFIALCEAPNEYVAKLIIDDMKEVSSPENFHLVDKAAKIELVCRRWIPDLDYPMNHNTTPPMVVTKQQKVYFQIPATEPSVKYGDILALTNFKDGILYLRNRDIHIKLANMQKCELEAFEKSPANGQFALCRYGNEIRRCQIKDFNNNFYAIEYIDYQSSDKVKIESLFNINDESINVPLIIKKRLRRFGDVECSKKAEETVQQLVRSKFIVTFIEDDVIDLKQNGNDKHQRSLSDILLGSVKYIHDLPKIKLDLNRNIELAVLHVEDNDNFFFYPKLQEYNLDKVCSLTNMENAPKINKLMKGQLCAALFEDAWYRGQVVAIDNDDITVYFLDFGNTDKVNADFIKEFPHDLLDISPLSVKGIFTADSILRGSETYGRSFISRIKQVGEVFQVTLLSELA